MLGFSAFATSTTITRIDQELEDVQWFSREEIAHGNPILSPGISIAFRLIEDWYDSGSDTPLRQTPGARLWDTMTRQPGK
jgi:NAD+ diphosphatase